MKRWALLLVVTAGCTGTIVRGNGGDARPATDGHPAIDGHAAVDAPVSPIPDAQGADARQPVPGFVVDQTRVDPSGIPQAALDTARHLDVLFGHQSVGGNLLDGLTELASANGARYGLGRNSLGESQTGWFDGNDGLGDFYVGSNGDPLGKYADFTRWVDTLGYGAHVDVAMMKVCFVDFEDGTPAAATSFASYRDTMAALEAAHPGVTFVYTTAPVKTTGSAARDAYNASVRQYVADHGKVLFDIAAIESHDPSGNAVTDAGHSAMLGAYSDDGGHLNATGRARVAGAFMYLLARLGGWGG